MKGVELPLSTIVIMVLILIVLLGIVALWMSGWGGGATAVSIQAATSAGCGALMRNANGCISVNPTSITFDGNTAGVPKFDVDNSGTFTVADNLQALCDKYYNSGGDQATCRKVCSCS